MATGSIFSDSFFAGLASSIGPVAEAQTLPPPCYTDREFFEFEKEALFRREWLCVGREAWVANPGDYFTSSHAGEPIVVVRDSAGVLRALSPVCRHRAMLVAEGSGNTKAFLCPYHHWSYALDGRLAGAPAMEKTCNFDRKAIHLPEFRLEVWLGFVFVNMDSDAAPLAPRLSAIAHAVERYDLANAEGPRPEPASRHHWNWKVMMENNNDGYHANRLHRGPLHDFVPSARASFPELPADSAGYFRYNGTLHPDAAFNATQKAVLPIFPRLTGADRERMIFANIPPTLSLAFSSDMVWYFILHAESADRHSMELGFLAAPGAMQQPGFAQRMAINTQAALEITEQDLHVDALVQLGLTSHFAERSQYSWQEEAQCAFNRWLVPRYRAAWVRRGGV